MKIRLSLILVFLCFFRTTFSKELDKENVLRNKIELVQYMKTYQNSIFLIFLSEKCQHSKNLLKTLPQTISIAKNVFKDKIKIKVFYCGDDGWCGRYFNVKAYPEFRFYFSTEDYKLNYMTHINRTKYEVEELFIFIQNRLAGMTYQQKKQDVNKFLNKKKGFFARYKFKAIIYCRENFDKEENKFIKQVVRVGGDLISINLSDCSTKSEATLPYLKQYFYSLENNNKTIGLIKFTNQEINLFDYGLQNFKEFVMKHKKQILLSLNQYAMNSILGNNQLVIILFLKEKNEQIQEIFQNIAYSYIDNDLIFAMHIEGQDKDQDYNSQHLRYMLGISQSDYPAIRILDYKSEKNFKMFFYDKPISQQMIINFIQLYFDGKLSTYDKQSLDYTDLLNDFHSIIQPFNRKMLTKNYVADKHTFVLIIEDTNNQKHLNVLKEYEKTILEILDEKEEQIEELISFQVASIYRENLDSFVPNELPVYLYLPQDQKVKSIGTYFWIQSHLNEMIHLILEQKSVMDKEHFLNLSNFKIEEL